MKFTLFEDEPVTEPVFTPGQSGEEFLVLDSRTGKTVDLVAPEPERIETEEPDPMLSEMMSESGR